MRFAFALSLLTLPLTADVTLPAIFGNGMVVQRDAPLRVWGTADANEAITVSFNGKKATAKASPAGTWLAELPAPKLDNKSHKLSVKGNNEITITDVLRTSRGDIGISISLKEW